MLKELLAKEQQYLNYFFDNLDLDSLQEIFDIFKHCPGMIVLTGVGKSGLIAKKIAATMTSTNTRAIYLSPVNALHGDLGIISEDDVFVFLSKSGESDELLNLIPSVRNKAVKTIAIVSNPESRLAKACDKYLCLPLEKELCPYNMAPTTSTSIQMIFGDIMAVGLMRHNKFSLDDFAQNHPAGSIGKKITVRVRDLMITGKSIPLCQETDKLFDTLVELSNKKCGCILITDKNKQLLGIFTDGDLRRTLQKFGPNGLNKQLHEVMSKDPRTIDPNTLATEAIKIMENSLSNEVSVLPVINENDEVIGLIKLHDIIQTGIS